MDVVQVGPNANWTIVQLHYKESVQNHPDATMQVDGIPQDHGELGLLPTQQTQYFAKLWHLWLFHKISAMVWLLIVEGLSIRK